MARFRARAVPGSGRAWYRVDLHVHSYLSFGADLAPAQVIAEAKAAGLEGLATTEHNKAEGRRQWNALRGEGLLVILGQEVVTGSGHWLALGLESGQVIEWEY